MKATLTLLIILFISACHNNHKPRLMTALEVIGQLNNDFCILIDIREKESITSMAAPARWVPLSMMTHNENSIKEILGTGLENKTIVVYGNKPGNAINACKLLVDNGFKCNYMVNYADWEAHGLPTKRL